jgi:hypothetical protein
MWMGAGEIYADERRRVRCLLEQKGQSRERERERERLRCNRSRERELGRVGCAVHGSDWEPGVIRRMCVCVISLAGLHVW